MSKLHPCSLRFLFSLSLNVKANIKANLALVIHRRRNENFEKSRQIYDIFRFAEGIKKNIQFQVKQLIYK